MDDNELGSAIRRCWGGERAPADLRQRAADLIAAERSRRSAWRPGSWGLATAAAVAALIGGGLLWPARPPAAMAAVIPVALEADLVQTHDQCSRGGDHQHLPAARSNGYAIAADLRSELDRPVLVGRPADPGWRFAGASVCPVGHVRSAHLVFRRADGDSLSLFSLPRSAAPAAVDGQQFQAEANHHPIVGFVSHGAVYCLVGSGCATDVSVARLADVRRHLRSQVVVADAATPVVPVDGELMHRSAVP